MDYSNVTKRLREKLMISQKELADLLGVSFETVNRWENGHHEPTIKVKRQIKELCKKNKIDFNSYMKEGETNA